MTDQNVQIVDLDTYAPSDSEIVSFVQLLRAPDHLEWDYDTRWTQDEGTDQEEIAEFHERRLKQQGTNYPLWAIYDGRVIGMIGINRLAGNGQDHCGELGFGVLKEYAGRGIGTRLLCAAIEKARAVGIKRLQADCFGDNIASATLLRKCGFVEEGLRVGAICKDGKPRDQRLFGLLL